MKKMFSVLAITASLGLPIHDSYGNFPVHGFLMQLPICPVPTSVVFPERGPRPYDLRKGTVDFGSDTKLFNYTEGTSDPNPRCFSGALEDTYYEVGLSSQSHFLYPEQRKNLPLTYQSPYTAHNHVLFRMTGYVSHLEESLVKGQMQIGARTSEDCLYVPGMARREIPKGMVYLVLSFKRSGTDQWIEARRISKAISLVSVCNLYSVPNAGIPVLSTLSIDAMVPPQSEIKLELKVAYRPIFISMQLSGSPLRIFPKKSDRNGMQDITIHEAFLFGAQCYPDFANSGQCL